MLICTNTARETFYSLIIIGHSESPYNEGIPIKSAQTHWYCIKGNAAPTILYVQIHDRLITFDFKSLLSGWTSRDVKIIYGSRAGAARNY
jgi:hypothetical protein